MLKMSSIVVGVVQWVIEGRMRSRMKWHGLVGFVVVLEIKRRRMMRMMMGYN